MRKIRQKEAVESWLKSQKNSIIYASPRMGKTKIGIEIINKSKVSRILIAYPHLIIQNSWDDDMQRWMKLKSNMIWQYSTFVSLKNHLVEDWDLIILDEIHMLSNAQIDVIKDYKLLFPNTEFLGLTGTLAQKTELYLKQELKIDICFKYPIEQAVKEGVISDYSIEVHTIDLDNKLFTNYGKKKKVLRTEKEQFDHLSKVINWMELNNKSTFFLRLARMRLIQNSWAKLQFTKRLLTGRNLVFCGTTAIADKIGCPAYHNKAKEKSIFDNFCIGNIDQLAVVKMLSMGVTINNLDNVILNYTDSNEENLIQKICRCLNYEYKDKTAKIIIISSTEKVEIQWIKKALKQLDKSKIKWI